VPLPMPRPLKHKKTGVYQLRRRVPADLVKLVGKKEVKVSLGTKDPAEAKARHFAEIFKLEERWANLRKGQQALSGKQVQALVGDIYRAKVAEHADDPGSPEIWRRLAVDDRRLQDLRRRTAGKPSALRLATGWSEAEAVVRARYGEAVDGFLADKGIVVTEEDRRRIVLAAAEATRLAHESILRNAQGDYSPDGNANRFPPLTSAAGPIRFAPIWADYQRQNKLSPATVKRWSPILKKFVAFVGVDDLSRITTADVIRWRDKMLSEGADLDPITVRDVYLAAPKALLGFASDQSKIGVNPAANVTVRVGKKKKVRRLGFSLEEANVILSASLAPQNDLSSQGLKDARRWVPWLCAYSGARVNEITQLRVQDICLSEGIWVMKVSSDAGTVKTSEGREVPLHGHVIEQGFLDFVRSKRSGPLFYETNPRRRASAANPPYVKVGGKLAEWVRAIGVTDTNVQPNHGWRHRFKTVGRGVGIESAKLDAIQGHAPRTEGEEYGGFLPTALKPEIEKIPRYDVVPAAALDRRKKGSRAKSLAELAASSDPKLLG
jgi:integrase